MVPQNTGYTLIVIYREARLTSSEEPYYHINYSVPFVNNYLTWNGKLLLNMLPLVKKKKIRYLYVCKYSLYLCYDCLPTL